MTSITLFANTSKRIVQEGTAFIAMPQDNKANVEPRSQRTERGHAMRAMERRLGKVEAAYGAPNAPRKGMRWIVSALGRDLNWETSYCTRHLCANGQLMEVAFINGDVEGNGVTPDEIDRFFERFPIRAYESGRTPLVRDKLWR